MNKIKVALICHFSNDTIRNVLHQRIPWYEKVGRAILKKAPPTLNDFAQWNTNAIQELSKVNNIELSVIAPAQYMQRKECCWEESNVHYYFFRDEDDYLVNKIGSVIRPHHYNRYEKNRIVIKHYLTQIKPDVVHVIGAENPYYSLSALDIPQEIPIIIQLQTLMSDPTFGRNYNGPKANYNYRSDVEKRVIQRANYVATTVDIYRQIITNNIKPNVSFLDLIFPLTEHVNLEDDKLKSFDFVYFANIISKACDLALEAFGIAHKKHPEISLDIIGNYTDVYKSNLHEIMKKHDIEDCVTFEGRLPRHEDVISQIRKSKFALLPLKIDITSSTIRESMANGLPVLTTITQGTPSLNKDYQCVLLSEIGDHQALADNMCKLIEDDKLAELLKTNGYRKASARRDNAEIVADWIKAYEEIVRQVCL